MRVDTVYVRTEDLLKLPRDVVDALLDEKKVINVDDRRIAGALLLDYGIGYDSLPAVFVEEAPGVYNILLSEHALEFLKNLRNIEKSATAGTG